MHRPCRNASLDECPPQNSDAGVQVLMDTALWHADVKVHVVLAAGSGNGNFIFSLHFPVQSMVDHLQRGRGAVSVMLLSH